MNFFFFVQFADDIVLIFDYLSIFSYEFVNLQLASKIIVCVMDLIKKCLNLTLT